MPSHSGTWQACHARTFLVRLQSTSMAWLFYNCRLAVSPFDQAILSNGDELAPTREQDVRMTPRIAFAVVFAFACGAASSNEAANQDLGSHPSARPNSLSPQADASQPGLQADTNWALPVIELVAPTQLPETIDLTSEPEELFQRMRQGFSMPNINNALVLHHQQWYLNHPESLRRMVERSSRYLHHIVEEIEKRGMPMELALLPMVESAYNPTAYSRSHASGLWQFVPSTGKQYKLEQNWWVDARRDIVASTAAALDYLQYIYDLHGDWHLALASYNWGEGAVGRAINKNKANGLSTDYLSLTMPEETRNYVPKLQALKNVFSNPNVLANLNIRGVPNRPYFATVTKTANIDVKLAAKLAEMPVQEFVALNPAHNRPVIKSETPMVIPADKVDTFISNLEAHEESEKPLSSWQAYTVKTGDKLEQIAPRFGMTVANLRAVNGINGKIKVGPGLTLLVAGQEGSEPAEGAALAEQQTLVVPPPRLTQPEPQPP
jgi:membrane-bound lytic murein transglycosylase D